MATNRLANNVDRENLVPSMQHIATKDAASSSRVHSVKKQAFSELKNVMHNQPHVTPFKGGKMTFGGSIKKEPSRGLSLITPSKENAGYMKPPITKKALDLNIHVDPIVELNEDFDFCSSKCSESCDKSLEYIWAQKNVPGQGFFDKLNAAWNLHEIYEDENSFDENFTDLLSNDIIPDLPPIPLDDLPPLSPMTLGPDDLPSMSMRADDFWDDFN